MVKIHVFLLTFFLFIGLSFYSYADDIEVSASIESNRAIENAPIAGLITVTHPKDQSIDLNGFKIEGKPLLVELIREDAIGHLLVSNYRFQLDPKPKGLYLLPSVKVSIGGKVFESIATSYEVQSAPKRSAAEGSKKTIFYLEAIYEGPSPLHIGERGFLIYRIYFNKDVDLSQSQLPFLKQKDFRQIGDVNVEEKQKGDISFQEIRTEIEAINAGSFTYGPATIEGTIYQTSILGEKERLEKIKAEAPAVTVVVVPFPADQIPPSFNGAVGEFSIKASIVGPSDIYVGDQVQVEVSISGEGNLSDIRLPNLLCQPGFSGLFYQSPAPPAGKIKDNTKTFSLQMRPQSTLIKSIPAIQFSYYNPKTKKYSRLETTPLPLSVKALPEVFDDAPKMADTAQGEWRKSLTDLPPIDIKGVEAIPFQGLYHENQGISIIWIVPIGALLIWLQIWWQTYRELLRRKRLAVSSQSVFTEALGSQHDPDKMLQGISKAFLLRLQEKAAITDATIAPEEIPSHGLCKEVRDFLCRLEAIRFGHEKPSSWHHIANQAQTLFSKL